MSKFNPVNDLYADYYAVMEQSSPQDNKIEILKCVENENGLNYLRFSTCLQDFYGRNRNKRLWKTEQIRQMAAQENVTELMKANSWCGEAGHPVPDTGQPTLERIVTIDPTNVSHRVTSLDWKKGGKELHGIVETLDEGVGSLGYKFMRNILQGMIPAFSLRSLVPQRKNPDGTTDVMGPGRMICYDRVYLPSHKGAYMDQEIPVKNIVTKPQFNMVMESFTDFVLNKSEKVNRIIDDLDPVMESVSYDTKADMITIQTKEMGRVFIAPEMKYRREIADFMKNL